jgi:phosphoglycerate dehydrogenase-like enzyme
MLSFERNLHHAVRNQIAGEWENEGGAIGELVDKRLAVIGVGAIGRRVAELGAALGMTVVGTKRDPSNSPEAVDEIYGPDELNVALADADYVVITCPLTSEAEGLIDADAFTTMRDDSVLVNVARGAIVDEDALVETLDAGRIRGAALDVCARTVRTREGETAVSHLASRLYIRILQILSNPQLLFKYITLYIYQYHSGITSLSYFYI